MSFSFPFSFSFHINFYSYKEATVLNKKVMLSRTGYTGELGFELYGSHCDIIEIWDRANDNFKKFGFPYQGQVGHANPLTLTSVEAGSCSPAMLVRPQMTG